MKLPSRVTAESSVINVVLEDDINTLSEIVLQLLELNVHLKNWAILLKRLAEVEINRSCQYQYCYGVKGKLSGVDIQSGATGRFFNKH